MEILAGRSIATLRQCLRVMLVLGVSIWIATPTWAESAFPESAIKAVFLFRFASYVEWPVTPPDGAPFTIVVMGDSDVASELRHLLPGRSIGGRSVQVRVAKSATDIDAAQILFLGIGSKTRQIVGTIGDRHVLVVTETDRGLEDGSAVNFLTVDRHVRFEVSLTAAQRAGLKISADLLSVATRVQGDRRGAVSPRVGV
jgi:hypothetical protein